MDDFYAHYFTVRTAMLRPLRLVIHLRKVLKFPPRVSYKWYVFDTGILHHWNVTERYPVSLSIPHTPWLEDEAWVRFTAKGDNMEEINACMHAYTLDVTRM